MSANREPMWYCHECHTEMRPLMTPDPHCASCQGTFVEMIDDPGDDPRQHALPDSLFFFNEGDPQRSGGEEGRRPVGGMGGILELLSSMVRPPADPAHERGGSGMRLVINTPTGMRSVQLGGANTLGNGGSSGGEGGVPRLSDFLASTTGPSSSGEGGPQTRRPPAPLLATYILSSLLNRSGRDPHEPIGMFDPFEMLAGGRYGDYVIHEQALENIMNELMANAPGQATDPPAPENIIDDLPRVVLEDGHPLVNDSCSICHEPFNAALAASPDAGADTNPSSSSSTAAGTASDSKDAADPLQPLVGVTLPCDHTFHEDCILPWLRMKSTCPVCRKSVLPGAQGSNAQGPSTPTGSSQQPRGSGDEDRPHIPGAWDGLD